jgi:hypothetical protein
MANKNPFASALGSTGGNKSNGNFIEALRNTSGSSSSAAENANSMLQNNSFTGLDQFGDQNSEFDQFQQYQEDLKKQEYDKKRLELHKRINPVDAHELFNARENATKNKIENIRKELKNLAREITKFHKEIDITLMGRATNSGLDGIGDESFFDKLRAFILLLTQKVRSARTWAQQNSKKKKKMAKRAKGLGKQMSESSGAEQRSKMEQHFNHERGDNWGE